MSGGVVDGLSVVWVDHGVVPEFCSLVEVGDAGCGDFEEGLGEAVDFSVEIDGVVKLEEAGTEGGVVEDVVDVGGEYVFVGGVGLEPGGVSFGFACGFDHGVLDAVDEGVVDEWWVGECAEDGLVEGVFVVGVG